MPRKTKSDNAQIRRQQAADLVKPAEEKPVADKAVDPDGELEKRIERLEKRLDEAPFGDAAAQEKTNHALDDSESEDALQKAVTRAAEKRGGAKS